MVRILVIDDEPLVRITIRRLLQASSHHVEGAGDGESGIRAGRARDSDLVIIDVIMPVQSGIDLIANPRRHNPALQDIAMSGGGPLGHGETLDAAMAAGATASLRKPFRNRQLAAIANQVLAGNYNPITPSAIG